MIQQIKKQDRLLFFPFDGVDPFLRLLNEAADNSDVISIKITIYRLASTSKIAHALCRAAENGKEVTVLMELRARFDEENILDGGLSEGYFILFFHAGMFFCFSGSI